MQSSYQSVQGDAYTLFSRFRGKNKKGRPTIDYATCISLTPYRCHLCERVRLPFIKQSFSNVTKSESTRIHTILPICKPFISTFNLPLILWELAEMKNQSIKKRNQNTTWQIFSWWNILKLPSLQYFKVTLQMKVKQEILLEVLRLFCFRMQANQERISPKWPNKEALIIKLQMHRFPFNEPWISSFL